MLLPAEVVGHVPVVGSRIAWRVRAALHVLAVHRRPAVVAIHVAADRRTGHRPADRRGRVAAARADLVAQDAADHTADDRARNIGIAVVLDDVLALDPAAL